MLQAATRQPSPSQPAHLCRSVIACTAAASSSERRGAASGLAAAPLARRPRRRCACSPRRVHISQRVLVIAQASYRYAPAQPPAWSLTLLAAASRATATVLLLVVRLSSIEACGATTEDDERRLHGSSRCESPSSARAKIVGAEGRGGGQPPSSATKCELAVGGCVRVLVALQRPPTSLPACASRRGASSAP